MHFSKMHGLGNDFMVVDATTQEISFSPEVIRFLSDRHFGVGFDQLLIVEPSCVPDLDFHYRIFNADGSEAAQCGNGARCFARFVHMKGLTTKRNIHVGTSNSRMLLTIVNEQLVRVNMGEPRFVPSQIPIRANKPRETYIITEAGCTMCSVVSVGNLHCVIRVDDIESTPVERLGRILEKHEYFPERVNVSFMQIIKREHIRLRVYERGVGETKSCGSAAGAAIAAGFSQGLLEEEVHVDCPGGRLDIFWKGAGYPLYLTGPASFVYDGLIHL